MRSLKGVARPDQWSENWGACIWVLNDKFFVAILKVQLSRTQRLFVQWSTHPATLNVTAVLLRKPLSLRFVTQECPSRQYPGHLIYPIHFSSDLSAFQLWRIEDLYRHNRRSRPLYVSYNRQRSLRVVSSSKGDNIVTQLQALRWAWGGVGLPRSSEPWSKDKNATRTHRSLNEENTNCFKNYRASQWKNRTTLRNTECLL